MFGSIYQIEWENGMPVVKVPQLTLGRQAEPTRQGILLATCRKGLKRIFAVVARIPSLAAAAP